jgi:hypothetical protein
MKPLDVKALSYLQAESKNLYYDDLLREISNYIDQARGYRKNRQLPAVLDAKSVATRVACRMLHEAGVFDRKGDSFRPSLDFLRRYLQEIFADGFRRRQKGQRLNSFDWALIVVSFAWKHKYDHPPSDNLMWALVNATSAVVTDKPQFRLLARRFSRRAKSVE